MTPPIFNLGDEVETKNGRRFEISQIWKKPDGSFAYSDPMVLWLPASELKLVNKAPLSPMWLTYNYKPDDYEHGTVHVSCPCGRKAEIALPEKSNWEEVPAELKIGDWVEVIRPDIDATGKIAKVIRVEPPSDDKYNIQLEDKSWWRPTSLRKLTPEEIEQHLVKDLPSPKDVFESRIVAYCRATNDGNISIHERLSAIEKRLSAIETLQFSQQDAIVCFESRLTFVEKFQRDQDDLVGRAIRDGVAEILDFRRKA